MKTFTLIGNAREEVGSRTAKELRNEGKVPCVIYGGTKPVHFWAHVHEFKPVVYTPDTFRINVEVEGQKFDTVIKDIQFHPVSERIEHVDFMELDSTRPVIVELPVALMGTAEGVRKGGKMALNLKRMKVRGMLSDIPERLEVNVEGLDLGRSVRVREVSFANLEVLNAASTPIATVTIPRALKQQGVA